ncbi:hypothetical protein KCP73_10480 [Salmonella enterica subsp. enterica]|nr:hypothetical protein KCP73_10480 [Salmonella enterica subsp. enterica]
MATYDCHNGDDPPYHHIIANRFKPVVQSESTTRQPLINAIQHQIQFMFKGDMNKNAPKRYRKVKSSHHASRWADYPQHRNNGDDAQAPRAKSRVRLALSFGAEPPCVGAGAWTQRREQIRTRRRSRFVAEITNSQMVEAVHTVRNVVPDPWFHRRYAGGGFTETLPPPVPLSETRA